MQRAVIFIAFVAAAIVGTLSHEMGHYLACVYYKVPASINYASTQWDMDAIVKIRERAIADNDIAGFKQMMNIIMLWGPIETLLTSAIGFAWLAVLSKRNRIDAYKPLHLIAIIFALFCSREVFNGIGTLVEIYLFNNNSLHSDEFRIFAHYNIPQWLGHSILLITCTTLCFWVCFTLVKSHRNQLIIFGISGSIIGYVLWIYWLGPLVLP